jgi:hypothetical protein
MNRHIKIIQFCKDISTVNYKIELTKNNQEIIIYGYRASIKHIQTILHNEW